MSVKFTVNFARIFLFLSFVGSLVSLGGGGSTLPPWKSTSWLTTSSTNVGVYGSCDNYGVSLQFFALDSNWLSMQGNQCQNIFNDASGSASMSGQLSPRDEIVVTGIYGLGSIFILAALFTLRERKPSIAAIFSFTSFALQAVAFSIATYQFHGIWTNLNAGVYNGLAVDPDENVQFGVGLYLGGASAISTLACAFLCWNANKLSSRQKDDIYVWNV